MIKVTKTIVKNGVVKSYPMLCEESQVEGLLKDPRFTLDESQEQPKEDPENDTSSNKKRKR